MFSIKDTYSKAFGVFVPVGTSFNAVNSITILKERNILSN